MATINTKTTIDTNIIVSICHLQQQLKEINLEEESMFWTCQFHISEEIWYKYTSIQGQRKYIIEHMLKQLENTENVQ